MTVFGVRFMRCLRLGAGTALLVATLLLVLACGKKEGSPPASPVVPDRSGARGDASGTIPVPAIGQTSVVLGKSGVGKTGTQTPTGQLNPAEFAPYLVFSQKVIEGVSSSPPAVDVTDVDSVFAYIFAHLPDEVTVYPSENYFYYIIYLGGTQYWGNIRLPSGRRERGVLSFAYFEFVEFPSVPGLGFSRSKYFTDADGVALKEIDKFTWEVRYNKRSVIFHFNQLKQIPPVSFKLGPDETFIERTFDESGMQYFLLFNTKSNYFFWVLNEEEIVPDTFEQIVDNVLQGQRTGFVFWVDKDRQNRKVLASVRSISVTRNDYYDGPFDQLADNYVDESHISEWMGRAYSGLKGRIDKYGYFTDTSFGSRVALSNYGTYFTIADIQNFVARALAEADPIYFFSRSGVPLATGQAENTPTASSTPTGGAP